MPRSNQEPEEALKLVSVTHRRRLAEIAGAFQTAETYADGVGKLVIV